MSDSVESTFYLARKVVITKDVEVVVQDGATLSITGNVLVNGVDPSKSSSTTLRYTYNNNPSPVGIDAGQFRLNNLDLAAVTNVYLSDSTEDGLDASNFLRTKVTAGETLYIQDRNDSNIWVEYKISAVSPDSTYVGFTVSFLKMNLPLSNNQSHIITLL